MITSLVYFVAWKYVTFFYPSFLPASTVVLNIGRGDRKGETIGENQGRKGEKGRIEVGRI